jgi:uncharacterized membrane protein YhaH (DUF805 family)
MRGVSYFFAFEGRIGRLEYLLVQLSIATFGLGTLFVAVSMGKAATKTTTIWAMDVGGVLVDAFVFYALGVIPILVFAFSSLTFCVRRLHDLNVSGWYCLIGIFLTLGGRFAVGLGATSVFAVCEGAAAIGWLALALMPRAPGIVRSA